MQSLFKIERGLNYPAYETLEKIMDFFDSEEEWPEYELEKLREVLRNNHQLQLVLLDIKLPCYDGFFWCKKIRQHSMIPVIFLSARNMDLDQIYAIECGGDDYLTNPFSYDVVTAKINAHLRRIYGEYALQERKTVELDHVVLNTETLKLEYLEHTIPLTKNEKDIS